jgi:hypothetical protein
MGKTGNGSARNADPLVCENHSSKLYHGLLKVTRGLASAPSRTRHDIDRQDPILLQQRNLPHAPLVTGFQFNQVTAGRGLPAGLIPSVP